jgi:hypothetical protein
MEMGTQTDGLFTPGTSPSHSDENKRIVEEDEIVPEPEEIDYTKIDLGPFSHLNHSQDFDGTTVNDSPRVAHSEHHLNGDDHSYVSEDEDDDYEEPVIFEAASAQATVIMPQAVKARGGLVDIPKRPPPPPLPPRNLARSSKVLMVDQASGQSPIRSPTSPTKDGFEDVDLHAVDSEQRSSLPKTGETEKEESAPKRDSLEHMVEVCLKEENLDSISPAVEEPLPILEAEKIPELKPATEVQHQEQVDEKEEFHSMPPTPNEQYVEVK